MKTRVVGAGLLKLGLVGLVTYWIVLNPVAHKLGGYPWVAPALMWGSILAMAFAAAAIFVSGQASLQKESKKGQKVSEEKKEGTSND